MKKEDVPKREGENLKVQSEEGISELAPLKSTDPSLYSDLTILNDCKRLAEENLHKRYPSVNEVDKKYPLLAQAREHEHDNPEVAIRLYRELCPSSGKAKVRLATLLYERDPETHIKEIVALYEQAAKEGDERGMFNFARFLEKGIGTDKNIPQAINWYKEVIKVSTNSSNEPKKILERPYAS